MTDEPDQTKPGGLPGFAWKQDVDGDWRLYLGNSPKLMHPGVFADGCFGWLSRGSMSFHTLNVNKALAPALVEQLRLATQDMPLYEAGLHVCGVLLLGGVYGKYQ